MGGLGGPVGGPWQGPMGAWRGPVGGRGPGGGALAGPGGMASGRPGGDRLSWERGLRPRLEVTPSPPRR